MYNLYFLYILYFVFSCIVLPFWRNKVYILACAYLHHHLFSALETFVITALYKSAFTIPYYTTVLNGGGFGEFGGEFGENRASSRWDARCLCRSRRGWRVSRPVLRAEMARSPRLSVGRLSICLDDTSSFPFAEPDAKTAAAADASTEGRPASAASGRSRDGGRATGTGFLSMSRKKQLTVASFSLSNLGVGCFFSILGPFFPNAVGYTTGQFLLGRESCRWYRNCPFLLTKVIIILIL